MKKIRSSLRRITNQVKGISLRHFRSPSSIFWSVVYPIILILLFGSMFGRSIDTSYNLDVLDWDDSKESNDFIQYLGNLTSLTINIIEEQVIIPENWLKENNKDILLVIPFNWGNRLSLNLTSNLTVYSDPSSSTAKAILVIIEEAVTELNFDLLNLETRFGFLVESYYIEELSFIDSFVPGIIMISVTTIALFTGLSYDLEEKHSGILLKLATTPTMKFEWILSKQIWQVILTLIASTLTILFALIFDFTATSLHPMMIVFVIYGTMTFTGIAMILVRIITNPDGVILASVLLTIPQIFLSGALFPLDTLPQFLQYIGRIFPLFYLTEGIRALMLDYTKTQFWLYFSISTILAFGLFILGILVTNWKKE